MSAGGFDLTKYEADDGKIFPIRVQPETVAATLGGEANDPPAGAVGSGLPSAIARGGKRVIGVKARRVTVRFATPPTGYKAGQLLQIPVLQKDTYLGLALNDAVSYLSATGVIVGKTAETIK